MTTINVKAVCCYCQRELGQDAVEIDENGKATLRLDPKGPGLFCDCVGARAAVREMLNSAERPS